MEPNKIIIIIIIIIRVIEGWDNGEHGRIKKKKDTQIEWNVHYGLRISMDKHKYPIK